MKEIFILTILCNMTYFTDGFPQLAKYIIKTLDQIRNIMTNTFFFLVSKINLLICFRGNDHFLFSQALRYTKALEYDGHAIVELLLG